MSPEQKGGKVTKDKEFNTCNLRQNLEVYISEDWIFLIIFFLIEKVDQECDFLELDKKIMHSKNIISKVKLCTNFLYILPLYIHMRNLCVYSGI